MQRAFQSPAGRAFVAKNLAIARLKQAKQLKKPIWVRAKDGALFAMDEWQINEMNTLKILLNDQKAPNSQDNPIDASELTKADLTLLATAFNKIAHGQFEQYYNDLEPEYKKSLTDKTVGEGILRTLITVAGAAQAKTLSAFLASYFLPNDMQKYLMVPQIIDPVVTYLTNEILKNNKLYPTILAGHEGILTACIFSKNGKSVATSALGEKNNLILWDAQTGNQLQTFSVNQGEIKDLAINHDGSKIVAKVKKHFEMPNLFDNNDIEAMPSKTILSIWDSKTGRLIKTLDDLPGAFIAQIEFSSDGETIVAGIDNDIEVASDTQQEQKSHIMIINAKNGSIIATHEIKNNFSNFEINPHGKTFLAPSEIDLILYDTITGKAIKTLGGPISEVYDAKYNLSGTKIIAYDGQAQAVFIWDAHTGEQQTIFNNIQSSRMAMNPDGTKLATIGFDGNITIWDIAQHNQLTSIESNSIFINTLIFGPDNNILAANDTLADTITFWNSTTGEKIRSFPNQHPQNSFVDITFNSTGTRMESHSESPANEKKCAIKLWQTASGKQIHSFIDKHELFSMNEDFTTIVSPDDNNSRNFILWKSLSKQEEDTLTKIEKNLSVVQAQMLYQLYMAKLNNEHISLPDIEKYNKELPADIQIMVARYLHARLPKINIPTPTQLIVPAQEIDAPKTDVTPIKKTWGQWLISGDWWKEFR